MSRARVVLLTAIASVGCYDGVDTDDLFAEEGLANESESESGDEAMDSSAGTGDGDGDPDPTTGDGDGAPDPTTGDGDGAPDPTTGDGDGAPDPTTGDGDGDPTTGGGEPSDVPDNAYCDPVSSWDPAWIAWEQQVLELVNQARAQGGNCGAQGNFGPSGPLTINPALTCAARVHSKDMADNDYFSHTNQQGQGPGWRAGQAGYGGGGVGENIAAGYGSPQQVIDGWLDSDGHCSNMLNPGYQEIGIGYAYGPGSSYGHYWTQVFGG